jgi:penicillin-binding protein 1A
MSDRIPPASLRSRGAGAIVRSLAVDPSAHEPLPADGGLSADLPAPSTTAAVASKTRPSHPRLRRASKLVALVALAGFLLGGGLLFAWTRELPAFDTLKDYEPLEATRVYGVDGSEVFQFARERRTVVPIDAIPDRLKQAVLAAEDARFYEHEGVNFLAIARCAVKGILRGGVACGGSTITQQVVKTFLLSSDSRVKRKVKELVLAPRLEENLSKDEILYLYLNQIYFGHRRYGVEQASRFYFGKGVEDLTLGEAAMIAGVVQSPARWSPVNHPDKAKDRQRYVLRRMVEEEFITKKEADAELAKPIVVNPPDPDAPGAWYADAIRRYLDERFGAERVETEGLRVDVAMDATLQREAEASLQANLRAIDKRQGWRGPLLHLDDAQLGQALPVWRERLGAAKGRRDALLVWDLGRVNPDDIEPGDDPGGDLRSMARLRPLEAGEVYAALVTKVGDKSATLDLGTATGLLPLADVAWARKFNPTAATPAPRKMSTVVKPGDVVLVRVREGKIPPAQAARAGQLLALSLEQVPQVQGALVAIDPITRGVRALVGGYDFATSQFNRATQAKRQPGSAFKAFVWGAAIESRRFNPATLVYDTPDLYRDPWTGKEWKPRNFERDAFDGPMLLQGALAHSKNTVSVKLVDALGVDPVIAFARRMGVASDLPRNLTLALGTGEVYPLELVNAYATLAARGFHAEPVLVLRVRDRHGELLEETVATTPPPAPAVPPEGMLQAAVASAPAPGDDAADGAPAFGDGEAPPSPPSPPVELPIPESGTRPDVAFVLTSMLREVVEAGSGVGARALGRPAAAKTGTAQEHRDAWFVGYTPELVAGVWIGFDDHGPLGPRETGAGAALPAWVSFMKAALGTKAVAEFPVAEGVEVARIDRATGLLAAEDAPDAPPLAFLAGTAPTTAAAPHPGSAPQNFFMDDR